MEGELIGRASELAVLAARIEAAARGSGSVVLLAGPAGVGKSTLAAEALRRHADRERITVVRGHCPRDSVAPPLWPWQHALRLAGVPLGLPAPRHSEPADAAAARFLELARLSGALAAVAAERPLVVLLEDLHWADTASLDLLCRLTGQITERGLLVVGTFREPAPEEPAGALAELGRYGARTLRLAPFTPAEVARCVGEADAARCHRRTGGLPLLVNALRVHGGGLGTVVSGLLAGLTGEQKDVVRAAAVLGEPLDTDLLAAVLPRLGAASVTAALEAAWHGGLLTTGNATGPGHRFIHDLIREEVVGRTGPAACRALHQAAARALGRAADPGDAARVAAHWRQAGPEPAHRAAAAHWSRKAADLARRQHAYADSARHLADAAAVLDAADPLRAPVLIDLARAEYLVGDYDAALRHCEEASEAAEARSRPELLAEAALVLQGVTYPRASRAITRLCEAALAVDGLQDALRARVLAQLATVSADLGSLGAAAGQARAAIELAGATGDARAELDAARASQMLLAHPDDTAERLRLGELAVSRARRLGDPPAEVLGHQWRVQAGYLLGRLDLVDDAVRGIEAVADRSPLPLARWHRLRVGAARAVQEGRFADARRANEDATALARAGGDQYAIMMGHVLRIQLALLRGDAAELSEEMWHDLDRAPANPLIRSMRARALLAAGRAEEARDAYHPLRPLLPVPTANPTWPAVLLNLVDLVESAEPAGDAEAARLVYDQFAPFRPYPGAVGTPTAYFSGTVSRDLGRLALTAGRPAQAEELLREALVRNRSLGAIPYVALTCLHLASVERDRGSLADATAHAREALAISGRLDMPGPAAAAARLIAETAARSDGAGPLTPREREIAELVVQARTNRQIAGDLFISERTVESHVRSILNKLGHANRTELTARWADHRPHEPSSDRRPVS
ncbi:helix-turn-helix transcriptional regulator [Streptomyces sp. NBC_00158]|uniref:helix-turn-helix transcriptional regulator n=1 Tax=Streptomyces sp. NBC_00158 TaxID=2903627 RepID=UPI00324CB8D5